MFRLKYENNGQISFEYLMLFIISLILINLLVIPMISTSIDYAEDLNTAYQMKAEMSKVSNGINQVYSTGSGSKSTVYLNIPTNTVFDINNGVLYCSILLKDNSSKIINVSSDDLDLNTRIHLYKGYNKLSIEWNNDSNIEIHRI